MPHLQYDSKQKQKQNKESTNPTACNYMQDDSRWAWINRQHELAPEMVQNARNHLERSQKGPKCCLQGPERVLVQDAANFSRWGK